MDAQRRHKLAPTPLSALGRALMGALLMCVYRKADESLQLTFMGDGPLKNMQVIAESGGYVKGRVGNPGLQLPLRPDGRVDVGGAVGKGAVLTASDTAAVHGQSVDHVSMNVIQSCHTRQQVGIVHHPEHLSYMVMSSRAFIGTSENHVILQAH
jgi:redox-regulated HSP33 family molecular chaperone